MTTITSRSFGCTKAGEPVTCWTLTNGSGMTAQILTYGGILQALTVPVGEERRDVVLGFDDVAGYENQDCYIGALVGRVANRIGNARFTLDGTEYRLAQNSGPNCLHGGIHGFHEKLWTPQVRGESLALTTVSPHGEEGFPGTLEVTVLYTLGDDNSLTLEYLAHSDAPTPVNLTNHSYFNLRGAGLGTIEEHKVGIFADFITENDDNSLPTGVLLPVEGTPFDLRTPTLLGPGLASDHPQILGGAGYDHNFVLTQTPDGVLRPAATAEWGGLELECLTTQPGLQLYTANYLSGQVGKGGLAYPRRSALCLETQNWPDGVNRPDFPSPILRPGQVYRQTTVYRFREV